jgi:valyl-tRNA synthetase
MGLAKGKKEFRRKKRKKKNYSIDSPPSPKTTQRHLGHGVWD